MNDFRLPFFIMFWMMSASRDLPLHLYTYTLIHLYTPLHLLNIKPQSLISQTFQERTSEDKVL